MESRGSHRSGLLTAGGVLSIVAGVSEINAGVLIFASGGYMPYPIWYFPFLPNVWWDPLMILYRWPGIVIIAGLLLALGLVAVVGGIWGIRRKRFGLALAGAICALNSGLLGILSIILVSLSKREFEAKK